MGVPRRFAETADWLAEQGLLIRRKLGLGELLFIPRARALHETMVQTMRRDPLFLVHDSHKKAQKTQEAQKRSIERESITN
jgi:hypothetical protein